MLQLKSKKGDTLIEVVLSFVMFSLVAAISLAVMHAGISGAEAAIELTLARVEIDAQSEAMRFIQEAYANDRAYPNLWRAITKLAHSEKEVDGTDNKVLPGLSTNSCSRLYGDDTADGPTLSSFNAFVLNSRKINDGTDAGKKEDYYGTTLIIRNDDKSKFSVSSLNPRLIYTTKDNTSDDEETTDTGLISEEPYEYVYRAEGIFGFLTKDTLDTETTKKPSHYDFHVYTCWLPPGADHPTTIGTVTRLYNPEYLNAH